jgi:hypothetical protein
MIEREERKKNISIFLSICVPTYIIGSEMQGYKTFIERGEKIRPTKSMNGDNNCLYVL